MMFAIIKTDDNDNYEIMFVARTKERAQQKINEMEKQFRKINEVQQQLNREEQIFTSTLGKPPIYPAPLRVITDPTELVFTGGEWKHPDMVKFAQERDERGRKISDWLGERRIELAREHNLPDDFNEWDCYYTSFRIEEVEELV